jgi:hypothetical protein
MTEQAMAVQVPASQDLREVAKQAFIDQQAEQKQRGRRASRRARTTSAAGCTCSKCSLRRWARMFTSDAGQKLQIGSQERWVVGAQGMRFTALTATAIYGTARYSSSTSARAVCFGAWRRARSSYLSELGAYLLGEAPPLSEFFDDEEQHPQAPVPRPACRRGRGGKGPRGTAARGTAAPAHHRRKAPATDRRNRHRRRARRDAGRSLNHQPLRLARRKESHHVDPATA